MNFRTTINIKPPTFKIDHQSKIVCLGSCFADNIGKKLSESKFDILCNPTGITYNPLSLSLSVLSAIKNSPLEEEHLFYQGGRWVHYDYHSIMSHTDKQETIQLIQKNSELLRDYLLSSDVLIISFGTAFVFHLLENNQLVNNCHKIPNKYFERSLSSVEVIKQSLSDTFESLWKINPNLQIITAISPIRHKRDGMVENQRSKSTLHLAIQELNEDYENIYYFPSYEIMLDDLRDYRFYDRDMIHPSAVAIDYIWNLFSEQLFNSPTAELNHKIRMINRAYTHRPFHPTSDKHKKFKEDQIKKIQSLLKTSPQLNFETELAYFKA